MMVTLFVLLAFTSTLLSSVFGFGSAMIVLAIGPYLLPGHEVIALSAILFIASTVTKTIAFRAYLHWPLVVTITIGSLPFAYLGGLLLPLLSLPVLQRCLGALILAHVCLTHAATRSVLQRWLPFGVPSNHRGDEPRTGDPVALAPPGRIHLIAVASSYGFVSGLVGSGSIIKALFFRRLELGKEAFVGTMAATSVVATIGKIAAYTQTGLLHQGLLAPMLALVLVAVAAVFIGRNFLQKINSDVFNHGVTVLLVVAGLGLII